MISNWFFIKYIYTLCVAVLWIYDNFYAFFKKFFVIFSSFESETRVNRSYLLKNCTKSFTRYKTTSHKNGFLSLSLSLRHTIICIHSYFLPCKNCEIKGFAGVVFDFDRCITKRVPSARAHRARIWVSAVTVNGLSKFNTVPCWLCVCVYGHSNWFDGCWIIR